MYISGKNIEEIKKYALSEKEIKECIDDGILSENINEIYVKEVNGKSNYH